MPKIVARNIAALVADIHEPGKLREAALKALQVAEEGGYAIDAQLVQEVCECLLEITEGETDPVRSARIRQAADILRRLPGG